MTQERRTKLTEILKSDGEQAKRLAALGPEAAMKQINAMGHDFTLDEINAFGGTGSNLDFELLELVSGGAMGDDMEADSINFFFCRNNFCS